MQAQSNSHTRTIVTTGKTSHTGCGALIIPDPGRNLSFSLNSSICRRLVLILAAKQGTACDQRNHQHFFHHFIPQTRSNAKITYFKDFTKLPNQGYLAPTFTSSQDGISTA